MGRAYAPGRGRAARGDTDGISRNRTQGLRIELSGSFVRRRPTGRRTRIGPDGSRVKIDERGIDLPDIDLPDVTPDVDIGTNEKGNPDIDVKGDKDGDKGPN